jgi:osmotically-inducible protein OsmY
MTTETDATGIGIPVTAAVRHALDMSDNLDASAVEVASHDGIVRLTGTVTSELELAAARCAALRTTGVSTVDDQVTVVNRQPANLTNSEIASAIGKSLEYAAGIPRETIQADVRDHTIILTGLVEWGYQRELAGHIASHLRNVRSVTNAIEVAGRPPVNQTRERIRRAFTHTAAHDADTMQIILDQDTVILSGIVSSPAERRQAEVAAAASTHVSQVINHLTVRPTPAHPPK